MGMPIQQTVAVVEVAQETSNWWIPLAVAAITGIFGVIIAKRTRKK